MGERVVLLLVGGHVVEGLVTPIQMDTILRAIHGHGELAGVVRLDGGEDTTKTEIMVKLDDIIAVRYLANAEAQDGE